MTKKVLGIGLVLGLGLMVAVGCGENTNLPTTGGVEYFPHTDGNKWIYVYYNVGSSPQVGTMEVKFNGTTL